MNYHTPVLLQEILKFLDPAPGKLFIDATIGGGGHTQGLLERGAKVLGIDRDPEAIDYVRAKVKGLGNLFLVRGNFNKIGEIARSHGFNKVDGILFDLGVSSHQLSEKRRGFSFAKVGPLDMRMDPTLQVTAADIINNFEIGRAHV